jgi:hypothetical protein
VSKGKLIALLDESEEVLKMADREWQLMASIVQGKRSDLKQIPSSDWIQFRQKYEAWYRSCIAFMTKNQLSGADDIKELYQGGHFHSPSIKFALLQGFSIKNYTAFRDRMENQVAILMAAIQEQEYKNQNPQKIETHKTPISPFIDLQRLEELREISSTEFDLVKLIRICEELNNCWSEECIFAVAILTRAILDHIPLIFGYKNFTQVANNHGGKSFKKSMQHLENSLRNIADAHLHSQIRSKETLPTKTQVNFSNDLDVLLGEIVRVLK